MSAALGLLLLSSAVAAAAPRDESCFARALPADIRAFRLDDAKLLIGWVFDAAAANRMPAPGTVIDHYSSLDQVPGFAPPTDLGGLKGRYRLMRAPFDAGRGYYGVELGALDAGDHATSLFLVNRLFRLPIVTQSPLGVLTDVATNGAMAGGWKTDAITDAEAAAAAAFADAEGQEGVPLLTLGQSQAGGEAQLQAAYLAAKFPHRQIATGFVSFNAIPIDASLRRLGVASDAVSGINFVKDLDPSFGPHGLLPNDLGLQVYIHPDGTGSGRPGQESTFAALAHPGQHLLAEFEAVSLTKALAATLDAGPDRCGI